MIVKESVETIAKVAYEANRAYCASLGDNSVPMWIVAPHEIRKGYVEGVETIMDRPGMPPMQLHEKWAEVRIKNGWKYGPVKDSRKKEHPNLVPWNKLPREQQQKDFLFRHIVLAFVDCW